MEGAPSTEEYYQSLGFGEVHSLDISAYEGATFIHDLNAPDIAEHLKGRYDVVLSGGTLEHVFNVTNALKAGIQLLKVGGVFFCGGPVNNWVDHGFWQIMPGLKFDFFATNGFDFGRSTASIALPEREFIRHVPMYPGEGQSLNLIPARVLHVLQAIKTEQSTADRVPLQSLYMQKHSGEFRGWRFRACEPIDTVGDQRVPAPMRRFPLAAPSVLVRDGCFAAPFRQEGLFPSLPPKRPFRSKALVYEDGVLLPWIVSDQSMVADRPGSFAHIGGHVFFSATDGSDPRRNGRSYVVAFPQPFRGILPYPEDPLYARRPNASADPPAT